MKTELTHKKEELSKVNERIHLLESDANKHQHSISQLEEALEIQKSKNNVSSLFIELKYFLIFLFDKFYVKLYFFYMYTYNLNLIAIFT